MRARPLACCAALLLASLVACPASAPTPTSPAGVGSSSASSSASIAAAASTSIDASAAASASVRARGSVPAPVYSDDACASDDDCAAVATCHPKKCVLTTHRGKLAHGTMCTEICQASSLDCGFNHCGCAAAPTGAKVCAVLPGPRQ
ncbi:MAG: hypothetical protein ACHREM_12105 [Polyangiales bacterium]